MTASWPPNPIQVEEFRQQDAKEGLRVAQMLEGFISRKVVKQTVMTVVYGVTRYGGRLQIEKRLRELSDFPQVRSLSRDPSVAPFSTGTLSLVSPNSSSPIKPGLWLWGVERGNLPAPPTWPSCLPPCPHRSLSGKPPTTSCARSSKVYRRCSPAPEPFRCVLQPSPILGALHPTVTHPTRCTVAPTALADRECQPHLSRGLACGVGDAPGYPHHPAVSPRVQGPGTWEMPFSSLLCPPPCPARTHLSPTPGLQVKGGIQSITLTSSVDENQ